MLLELVIAACIAVLAFVVLQVALIGLRNHKAHKFFKTHIPNLPVFPNKNIIFGSTEFFFGKRKWREADEIHKKLGKYVGFYYGREPWISTTDLDLIKRMTIDDPGKHCDRPNLCLPISEYDQDCILFAETEQWRRIRRAIAPALT